MRKENDSALMGLKIENGRIEITAQLSKREYFAGLAMQASVAANDHHNPEWHNEESAKKHARGAVLLADALLRELSYDEG